MECEMCGKQVGTRRYMVDGTVMNLGMCCSKYGTALDGPAAPAGSKAAVEQNLQRRAGRQRSRDVFSEQETWDLVEDYGQRVRKAREQRGWDHARLGDKVSARVPELRQVEANQLRPSDRLAKALEKELQITLLEKVDATAPKVSGQKKGGGSGLTIGDLLKDAMDKE